MNIHEALKIGKEILQREGVESPFLDSKILLSTATNIDREEIVFNPSKEISDNSFKIYLNLILRRSKKEPLSHIIEKRSFWDWDFKVTKDTLDPRPDSEAIIEAILKIFPKKDGKFNVLELGVGTGCLIITTLKLFLNSTGEAVDISKKAIGIAKHNAKKLNVDGRLKIYESDWFSNISNQFDLIISNPPYIAEGLLKTLSDEVKKYEPRNALTSGEDGLEDYKKISSNVYKHLKNYGYLVLEIGDNQASSVKEIYSEAGLKFIFSQKDLTGTERALVFQKIS